MPASIPIANDYKVWDWQQTVTYSVRTSGDTFGSSVTDVKCVREDIGNVADPVDVKETNWHVPNTLISTVTPKAGDKITDSNSVDWFIDFAQRDPSGNYWLFHTWKAVSSDT